METITPLSSSSNSTSDCPPSVATSVFLDGKEPALSGDSSSSVSLSGPFVSVAPTSSTVAGRDLTIHSDTTGASWEQDSASQSRNDDHNMPAESTFQGTPKTGDSIFTGDSNFVHQDQMTYPCSLSSSLYYGGQDICKLPSKSPQSSKKYKMDGKDDSGSSDIDSRGNWWQGSLYY